LVLESISKNYPKGKIRNPSGPDLEEDMESKMEGVLGCLGDL